MPRAECGLIRGECGDSLSCLGREFDPLPLGLRTSVTFREESHSLLACRSPGAVRGTVSGHRAGARGRFRGRIRAIRRGGRPDRGGGIVSDCRSSRAPCRGGCAAGPESVHEPSTIRRFRGQRIWSGNNQGLFSSGIVSGRPEPLRSLFRPPGTGTQARGMRACARVKYPRRRLRNGATRARDSIKKCSINQLLTAFLAL